MAFDVAGLIGALVGTAVDVASQLDDAKKAQTMIGEIRKLSNKQQIELADKLNEVKTLTEKESVIYKYLAISKHQEELDKIFAKRNLVYALSIAGLLVLTVITIKLKNKNG